MKKKKLIVILAVLILALIVAIAVIFSQNNNEDVADNSDVNQQEAVDEGSWSGENGEGFTQDPSKVKYEKLDSVAMMKELETNPSAAKDKYYLKFVEVDATLNDRDIEAEWFDLSVDNDSELLITCTTLEDDILSQAADSKLGSKVTIKGQIVNIDKDYGYDILVSEYILR